MLANFAAILVFPEFCNRIEGEADGGETVPGWLNLANSRLTSYARGAVLPSTVLTAP